MIELGGVDNLVFGAVAFIVTFIALILIWAAFVRTLFSVFGKTKFYFIPKTLKELFLSVAFIFILISEIIERYFFYQSYHREGI